MYIHLPKKPQPVTLGDLKEELSAVTAIPYDQMQVITHGVLMKDDRAPLYKYRLRDGDSVTLVGQAASLHPDRIPRKQSQHPHASPHHHGPQQGHPAASTSSRPTAEFEAQQAAAAARKAVEADQSEQGILRRIQAAQQVAQIDLAPEVEQLERSVAAVETYGLEKRAVGTEVPASSISLTQVNADTRGLLNLHQLVFSHKKLSELLLRQLLSLDNVQAPTDQLRLARKMAVKQVQAMLDRVDAAWTKAKALGVKAHM